MIDLKIKKCKKKEKIFFSWFKIIKEILINISVV